MVYEWPSYKIWVSTRFGIAFGIAENKIISVEQRYYAPNYTICSLSYYILNVVLFADVE